MRGLPGNIWNAAPSPVAWRAADHCANKQCTQAANVSRCAGAAAHRSGFLKGLCTPLLGVERMDATNGSISNSCVSGTCGVGGSENTT